MTAITGCEICEQAGIAYPTRDVNVPDRKPRLSGLLATSLGKRNLTDERKSYLRGKHYEDARKAHGEPKRFDFGDGEKSDDVIDSAARCHSDTLGKKTAETVAEKHGVSPRTIHRDAEFTAAVDAKPLKDREKILSGASGLTKKQIVDSAKKTRSSREPKAGAPKYDWREFNRAFGVVARARTPS